MYIIFGDDQVASMREKYSILELDTIRIGAHGPELKAYAVVENIAIPDLPMVESWTKLHENLINYYRKKDWNFCEQAIDNLIGSFNGELDSFYSEIQSRVNSYKENNPGEDWDWVIEKTSTPDPLQS
jgi:hypothetical protein